MRTQQNIKTVMMNESSNGSVTGAVDTQGFRFCRISCTHSTNAVVNTNTFIEQSDDNSTWVPIPNMVAGVDYTLSTSVNITTKPKVIWDVNLIGKKRYLKASVGTGTGRLALTATLSDPIDGVTNRTDAGSDIYAVG